MLNRFIMIACLYSIFSLLEMRFYAEKGQHFLNKAHNIFYGIILFATGIAITYFINYYIPFKARHLDDRGIWFSLLMLVVYLLATDFIFYWYHRAQHSNKYFWKIHELHHSDKELNVTSSMRTFWLEQPLQVLLITTPIRFIIGVDSRAVMFFSIIFMLWLFFTHANLKIRLGFLTPIICGPQFHRIHHSNLPQHQGKNLSQFFPVIDMIFGTYYRPAYDEFPSTGLLEHSAETAPIKSASS